MVPFQLTDEQVTSFHHDGYLLVEELFDAEEMDLLLGIGKADQALARDATTRRDAEGGVTKLAVRNDLRDDIYGAIVRSPRLVRTMEKLLGDEVYHWHHKMMLKEPRTGGAWDWHQDYGYWYNDGCLFPDMASVTIAIDRATRENGCLQVIKGSHNIGRVDHDKAAGGQTGADMERVHAALKQMELVHIEAAPGTALFFHGNLLHRSDQNRSEHPRWSLICCYNTRHNDPYKPSKHPSYSPLEVGTDEDVVRVGRRDALLNSSQC